MLTCVLTAYASARRLSRGEACVISLAVFRALVTKPRSGTHCQHSGSAVLEGAVFVSSRGHLLPPGEAERGSVFSVFAHLGESYPQLAAGKRKVKER